MSSVRIIFPYLIAAVFVITAAYYGVSKSLGAHPFWSMKIAWIGTPIGLLLALLVRNRAWFKRSITFAILLLASGAAAHFGRLRFAASFAEDRLAGQFWFYGWIAVAIFLSALIASVLTPRPQRL